MQAQIASPDQTRHRQSTRSRVLAAAAVLGVMATQGGGAAAAPVRIYSAGSLKAAMQALIGGSGLPAAAFAEPVFGPAGLMRERLEKGERADLFTSADMAQPARLAKADPKIRVLPFAGNRMCVLSKATLGLDADGLLDRLLSADVRLATSTPGADPGGDYAMAVFDKADAIRPGSGATLRAKAMHLLGSPKAVAPGGGRNTAASIFIEDKADALIYYCSGAPALLKEVPGLVSLPMPEALEVHPTYGLAVLTDDPDAARFAAFIRSPEGQGILSRFGFVPPPAVGD